MNKSTQSVEISLATSPAESSKNTRTRNCRLWLGFTLLELMIVISIMMILMAVAVPLYSHHVTQAREAVLRQNLHQLNSLIVQYQMDHGKAPQQLEDLIPQYLSKLPVDPMTEKADWVPDMEDPSNAVDPQQPGIDRVHSASPATGLNDKPYAEWE